MREEATGAVSQVKDAIEALRRGQVETRAAADSAKEDVDGILKSVEEELAGNFDFLFCLAFCRRAALRFCPFINICSLLTCRRIAWVSFIEGGSVPLKCSRQ